MAFTIGAKVMINPMVDIRDKGVDVLVTNYPVIASSDDWVIQQEDLSSGYVKVFSKLLDKMYWLNFKHLMQIG